MMSLISEENDGISPNGKALDSDSSIWGFDSLYPSYLKDHYCVVVFLFYRKVRSTKQKRPEDVHTYILLNQVRVLIK